MSRARDIRPMSSRVGRLGGRTRREDDTTLPSITEFFVHDDPDCPWCHGSGTVCENHPGRPWGEGDGCCGAAGMPCPRIPG